MLYYVFFISWISCISQLEGASIQKEVTEDTATYTISQGGWNSSKEIIDQYKIVVEFNEPVTNNLIKSLHQELCSLLELPESNVIFTNVDESANTLELYFVYTILESSSIDDDDKNIVTVLIPAHAILKVVNKKSLEAFGFHIKDIYAKTESQPVFAERKYDLDVLTFLEGPQWLPWKLTGLIIIAILLFILLLLCIDASVMNRYPSRLGRSIVDSTFFSRLYCCFRRQHKHKSDFYDKPCHIVYQPVVKPCFSHLDAIQPENHDICGAETDSEHTPSPSRSPLKTKTKRLLERRGSNASLTLDLNKIPESVQTGTLPKERRSAEQFLLSAGNRLTRRQLRNCLKDVKALHLEFWEIPMNHPEKVEIPGCGTKNRYKTILPNEHSRVHLKLDTDDPLTCYINANYIRGYDGEPKAYIATQGPMAHTVIDFWDMIWQEKVPIIIMITKLTEKAKIKCEQYFPDSYGTYGDISVHVTKEIPRDGYTIHELLLRKGTEHMQVLHFWYTAWPDHKTPYTAKQLVAMALEVEALRHDNNRVVKGPIVVHCSAGIGRTGCFIAASIGIEQLLEENVVDVLGIVCALRMDRGGMVQTAEQYEFVHQSLCLFEQSLPELPDEEK